MFVCKFEERHRTKHDAKLINIIAAYFHDNGKQFEQSNIYLYL